MAKLSSSDENACLDGLQNLLPGSRDPGSGQSSLIPTPVPPAEHLGVTETVSYSSQHGLWRPQPEGPLTIACGLHQTARSSELTDGVVFRNRMTANVF